MNYTDARLGMKHLATIRNDLPRPSPIPLRVRRADDAVTVGRHVREQPRLIVQYSGEDDA